MKQSRRYAATVSAAAAPTFRYGSVAFHLDLLIAVCDGAEMRVRPQEARLLGILHRALGAVVAYDTICNELYGIRVPSEHGRARLKSLVADIRRRFGTSMQVALLTAPGKGLLLRGACGNDRKPSEPCDAARTACVAPTSDIWEVAIAPKSSVAAATRASESFDVRNERLARPHHVAMPRSATLSSGPSPESTKPPQRGV